MIDVERIMTKTRNTRQLDVYMVERFLGFVQRLKVLMINVLTYAMTV